MPNPAVIALDYAIELAEQADAQAHILAGKIDAVVHSTVDKLKAMREKLLQVFGASGPGEPESIANVEHVHYARLSEADRAEVDCRVEAIRAAR